MKTTKRAVAIVLAVMIAFNANANIQASFLCKQHDRQEVNNEEGRKNHTPAGEDPIAAAFESFWN